MAETMRLVAPQRVKSGGGVGGGTRPAHAISAGIFVLIVSRHYFVFSSTQLVALVSALVKVSTVWSVSCLLFYSRCLPCLAFVKVERRGHVTPCPVESAPLYALSSLRITHSQGQSLEEDGTFIFNDKRVNYACQAM